MDSQYRQTAVFELRFWLQILGDHARFIRDSLSPEEKKEVERARHFITIFDTLLTHIHPQTDLRTLSRQVNQQAREIRQFKLHLLQRHLTGKILLGLSPTFINHMVSEVDEAIRIFDYLTEGQIPPIQHPIHHHLLWLLDAAGHAGAIDAELDLVEKRMKQKSRSFTRHFEDFYLKAVELAGYLRTSLPDFPALQRFNQQTKLEILLFRTFLAELEELRMDKETLGTLTPLMADHMAREECYYLMKLAESTRLQPPECDPGKPRVQG
ncbi:DUF2935 domain-containing protein [Salinithrix halophila]|uniref:DUF2935 domain-containing protein n=1 Tax=Salinithrix halophila TaxID=1485204 RepID=A0ABV8JLD8_9BACL